MTRVTPWSDAARALVGAAFGDPTMRNEADKIDLQRQQVQQDAKRLLLEEAFNPAKISQAEAAARYSNAQADNEGLTFTSRQDFLNGGGGDSPPTYPPATSPYANGGNPALGANVDDIVPAISEADIAELTGMPVPTGRTDPPPMGMQGMGPAPSADPTFEQVLAGLTAPPGMQDPMAAPPAVQASVQQAPVTLEQLLTPTVRQMMTAGYMPETSLPDLLLAIEGQSANQGITDPSQRLTNAAAGRGTFVSPDQLAATTMNNNIPAADVANRGFENMLPTSVQEFRAGQADPAFMDYLNMKEAQPGLTVTTDANGKQVVSYGKSGSNKGALTEAQGRASLFATRAAVAGANLDKALATDYGRNIGNIDIQNAADYIAGMSKPDSAAGALMMNAIKSPEGRKMYQAANSFLVGIVRPDSGAALTPDEWLVYGAVFLPMPGDDAATLAQKAADRKIATLALQGISAGGATQIAQLLQSRGVQIPEELAALTGGDTAPQQPSTSGATTINTREEYDALPPGSTYIDAMTGQQAVKQ